MINQRSQTMQRFAYPPTNDWSMWIIEGDRGTGKTRLILEYCIEHLYDLEDQAYVLIVGANSSQWGGVILPALVDLDPAMFPDPSFGRFSIKTALGGYVYFATPDRLRWFRGAQPTLFCIDNTDALRIQSEADINNMIGYVAGFSSCSDACRIIMSVFKPEWLIRLEQRVPQANNKCVVSQLYGRP